MAANATKTIETKHNFVLNDSIDKTASYFSQKDFDDIELIREIVVYLDVMSFVEG